jgi:hypothetical protein
MTRYLARLAGLSKTTAHQLGRYAGDKPGGADSPEFEVNKPKWPFYSAERWAIHFPTEEQLAKFKSTFWADLNSGTEAGMRSAGHTLHSIEDGHGAHRNYIGNPLGHGVDSALGQDPDVIIGDQAFVNVANELYQFLKKDPNARLTNEQMNELIDAIIQECGKDANKLKITRPVLPPIGPISAGDSAGFPSFGPGLGEWYYRWFWSLEPPPPPERDAFA